MLTLEKLRLVMSANLTKLEFSLEDQLDGKKLSPKNVNFPILLEFLEDTGRLIRGNKTNAVLADSRVALEEGSLKVVSLVAAAVAAHFESEMAKLHRTRDLDSIERGRSEVISKWQEATQKNPQRLYGVGAADSSYRFKIVRGNEYQYKSENAWVPVEKYLTGILEEVGGKRVTNLHLSLPTTGETLPVNATKEQLSARQHQLYQAVTLFVRAEQHLLTRNLRNVHLIEFIKDDAAIDESALKRLWQRGSAAWSDVKSPSDWVEELRGH